MSKYTLNGTMDTLSPTLSRRKTPSLSRMSKSKSMWNMSEVGRRNTLFSERAKLTQLLKTTQLEQLSRLQSKHQQECDLLDDIRNFGKQRSQLEREYALALQKLVQQYQRKDVSSKPQTIEGNHSTILGVWQSVLEATDKAAQARIKSSDCYKNGIYEAAKNFRTQKETSLKKCQDLLNTLQNEMTETVKELTKTKKKYFELEQVAFDARKKFQEVEERIKKNQSGIFNKSKSALEKSSQKLEQKCEECNKSSTVARNDYILALATANAHQKKYYEVDIPECMKILDGDIYTRLQDYLSATSRFELEACGATQEAYATALQRSTMISREFSIHCFLRDNPTFEWGPKYDFEACEDDPNTGRLVAEQGSAGDDNSLNREARKWATKFVKEKKQLQRLARLRQNLEGIRNKYNENPELANESSLADTAARLEKCVEDTRRLETHRLKSESKLDVLRDAPGVNVDTWIRSAMAQLAKEPGSVPSTPMDPNKNFIVTDGGTPNGHPCIVGDSSFFDDDFDDTFDEAFDDDVSHDDEVSLTASDHSRVYPVSCKVIYEYKATRPDELTISPGDTVEVVEDGDLEQWVKARDRDNQVGYVPEKYLEFPPPSNSNAVSNNHSMASAKFEKSTASSNQSNVYGGSINSTDTGTLSSISENSSTSGTSSLTTASSTSASQNREPESGGAMLFAKAIYEYQGCTDDELSFPEGAVVRIVSKDDSGVDDGWWKGELNGVVGLFPALVVEEITADDRPPPALKVNAWADDSPDLDGPPPSFHPPPPTTLDIPQNIGNAASTSLPTTPTKQNRPAPSRIAPPPPPGRPRSATRPI